MRVVFDANVWLSAFLTPSGSPGRAIDAAFDGPTEIVSTIIRGRSSWA
jgi:predicted nucleic acid-binding protein